MARVIQAGQAIDGGPSVLYDAIALLVSEAGAKSLINNPAARDFVADGYAHAKFIGYSQAATALIEEGCWRSDDGCRFHRAQRTQGCGGVRARMPPIAVLGRVIRMRVVKACCGVKAELASTQRGRIER